jgi:predicted ATPase/class 3 adenylate cyclase/Tfp pilus assembly protein PilF
LQTLPTGTVTFLFTDIEGSTALLSALGSDGYAALLARHSQIMRDAFGPRGGIEIGREGDSFMVAFAAADSGLAAAVQAQRVLAVEAWPPDAAVRVRMGLHTGEALVAGDRYVGMSVHEAARVAAAAHGGQILLSATTSALVRTALEPGIAIRDLGEHLLRGIEGSQRLAQVVIDGLPADFPPLKSAGAPGVRLPAQLSSFVARPKETGDVEALLARARLVTLVGPGGTGKTRLAIECAERVAHRFIDGVHWVPLAGVMDADLVAGAIAASLELHVDPTRPTADALKAHLGERRLLLVIDNAERVLDAAPLIGELLAAAPGITALVTSRTRLYLPGEQQYPVPPLGLPDQAEAATAAGLRESAAVQLFVERAGEVDPGFALTDANAAAIAEICERLDGLPLAIELAAARVDLLPIDALRSRMEDRLSLLASRTPGVDERQRTLRGAIDWSHELLDAPIARAFRQLGVFVGGFTLEAASAVIDSPADQALGAVSALLDTSLLRREPGRSVPRYRMLETVREYALERLIAESEVDAVQRRAAAFWLGVFAPLGPDLHSGLPDALAAVEDDYGNIRAALAWELGGVPGQPFAEPADAALGAELCGALGPFWALSMVREGSGWMTRALQCAADQPTALRARLSFLAGVLFDQEGRDTDAEAILSHALALFQEIGDHVGEARATNSLGVVARGRGDLEDARARFEEGLRLRERLGMSITNTLNNLGVVATDQDRLDEARALFTRAIELDWAADDRVGVATARSNLAAVALRSGDVAGAEELLRRSLSGFIEAGDTVGIAEDLERSAEAAVLREQLERAATLYGAAAALRDDESIPQPPIDRERQDGLVRDLRARLGEPFAAAWEHGGIMSRDSAVAFALQLPS